MSNDCEKTVNVKYIFSAEWADEESKEIFLAAKSIVCCECEDDNGDGDDDD